MYNSDILTLMITAEKQREITGESDLFHIPSESEVCPCFYLPAAENLSLPLTYSVHRVSVNMKIEKNRTYIIILRGGNVTDKNHATKFLKSSIYAQILQSFNSE